MAMRARVLNVSTHEYARLFNLVKCNHNEHSNVLGTVFCVGAKRGAAPRPVAQPIFLLGHGRTL